MRAALDLIVAGLLVTGAFFTFTAALGLLRLPDLFTRMHAASKAGTAGSGLLLLAAGLHAQDGAILSRILVGLAFFLIGAPVAAHLIARAARSTGEDTMRKKKSENPKG